LKCVRHPVTSLAKKTWIPGQARNDKISHTPSFDNYGTVSFAGMTVDAVLDVLHVVQTLEPLVASGGVTGLCASGVRV